MQTILFGKKNVVPSKIICVGRNYVAHIIELENEMPDEMVLFLKPNSAVSNELKSFHDEPLHYEAELCFMVERGRFSAVGFGLDLTKRALQKKLKTKGLPWERAKAFDGSAVFSPFVRIPENCKQLNFELYINGEKRQNGNPELMIHSPDKILSEIKGFMTLSDGDIVMTGTPKGVGIIHKGDRFEGVVKDHQHLLVKGEWVAG